MKSLRAAVLALLCLSLVACGSEQGRINRETEDRRYRACLDSGGSYSTDDTDWRCDRVPLTDDRATPTNE